MTIPDNVDEEMYLAGVEAFRRGLGLFISLYMIELTVPSVSEDDLRDFRRGYEDSSTVANPNAS